tara:strand:- start:1038 stop:2087 length:1050 start_codon:yes stop_codon:yes gene_type:complete
MAYSFKDIKVSVNGTGIYCSAADLQYTAEYSPAFNIESSRSNTYLASKPVQGSLNLSYFLTGADPLANFSDKGATFALDVGGLTINSGYLSSYKLGSNPFQPIFADVSLVFYEDIKGEIDPTSDSSKKLDLLDRIVPLSVSDLTIDGGISVKQGEAVSLTYNYGVPVEPSYLVGQRHPNRMVFGPEKAEASVVLYSYDMELLPTGVRENFKINLNDKNDITKQSFIINSQVGQKSFSSNAGEGRNYVELNMGQTNLGTFDGEGPVISDMVPDSGDTGDIVKLQGNNFVTVDKVLLGQFPCQISGYDSEEIAFYVPREVFSGYKAPVYLLSNGEKISSPTGFLVTGGVTF